MARASVLCKNSLPLPLLSSDACALLPGGLITIEIGGAERLKRKHSASVFSSIAQRYGERLYEAHRQFGYFFTRS